MKKWLSSEVELLWNHMKYGPCHVKQRDMVKQAKAILNEPK